MKRKRFSEEQIIGILKEHEAGVSVSDLCRKHGVSDASIYEWKAKYSGLDVSEAKRLNALEDDNNKLKKLLAGAMLDNLMLRDLNSKNGDTRCSVGSGGLSCRTTRGEPTAGLPGCGVLPDDNPVHVRTA